MKTLIPLLLTFVCVGFALAQDKFKEVDLSASQFQGYTLDELAEAAADSQPEILRKATLHYLKSQLGSRSEDKKSKPEEMLKQWMSRELADKTFDSITNYMRSKLQSRLGYQLINAGIEKLSSSFQREIKAQPEDYFLTFDMYDLLIDE